jgi:predicted esterase
MRYELEVVSTGKARISTLFAGRPDAPPLVLLHGLGGTERRLCANASIPEIRPSSISRHVATSVTISASGA